MKKIVIAALLTVLALPLGYYAVGYAVASQKANTCEELAFHEAISKNIRGFDVHGAETAVQRSEVVSSISPFEVEVTYSVPRDLHATVFTKKFQVSMFGDVTPGKLETIYLV